MNKLTLALALLIPGTAFASSTLFTLSPYNALVFGSFADTADFGGGIAAGGSLTISNTTVASNLLGEPLTDFPGQYTLVAGGTLNATNGAVAAGNVYGGGPSNSFSLTMNGGGQYKTSPVTADPIDFSAQAAYFKGLSSTLANLSSTGTCSYDGFSTTTCTATAAGLNVIKVTDPTILGTNRTVNINLGTNSFVVIDVAGAATDYMSNYGFNIYQNGFNKGSSNGDSTTTLAHDVLFNYYQATTLDITSVVGSVLAANANVSGIASGQIDGTLVANAFNGPTEFHNFGYEGPLPTPTPEPMSYMLVGASLVGMAAMSRKWSR